MSPLKETLGALGVGVAIAAIVACGGAKSTGMAPVTASPDSPPGGATDPRARITTLDKTITDEFAKLELGLRPEAPPSMAADLCPTPPCTTAEPLAVKPSDDPKCLKGESQTCKDTCVIADAICGAATTICEIAESMKNDAWAIEKCASGNASCEKSRGKCCGCL
jgi:hypothetical protein